MSRDDETGEFANPNGLDEAAIPGEPVGRINLLEEPEPDVMIQDADPGDAGKAAALASPRDEMMQKALFGLIAVLMMILAMIIMLQGVFEQKMPV